MECRGARQTPPGQALVHRRNHMLKPNCKPLPPLSQSDIERFWSKVDRSAGPDACWPWTGCILATTGYGQISINTGGARSLFSTHRIAYFLHHGEDPYPLLVCHECDNRPCCNGRHLFKGTHQDNEDDKVSKGRQATGLRHGRHTHPERTASGERNKGARLTADQVLEMRKLFSDGWSRRALSEKFGVARAHASGIISRKYWAHL